MTWSSSNLDYKSLIHEASLSAAAAADETTASVPAAAAPKEEAAVAVLAPKPKGKVGKMIIELIVEKGYDVDNCQLELMKHFSNTSTHDAIAQYHPLYDGSHRWKGRYLHLVATARAAKQEEEERKRAAERLREARSWGLYGSRMPPEEEAKHEPEVKNKKKAKYGAGENLAAQYRKAGKNQQECYLALKELDLCESTYWKLIMKYYGTTMHAYNCGRFLQEVAARNPSSSAASSSPAADTDPSSSSAAAAATDEPDASESSGEEQVVYSGASPDAENAAPAASSLPMPRFA